MAAYTFIWFGKGDIRQISDLRIVSVEDQSEEIINSMNVNIAKILALI